MLANSKLQTIICSSRIAQAERFYSDVLELPLRGRSEGALVYEVGGSVLRVSSVPSAEPTAHAVAGCAIEGLDAIVTRLGRRA